jgi:hypothetical protein
MTRNSGVGQHRKERHGAAIVKIRYRNANELPPGLNATAERHGGTINVYLAPGLTTDERNAVLRRLRLSGRTGYGPRLPAVQLAFALLADRIRTTIARAGSVFRVHPAGTTGDHRAGHADIRRGDRLPGAVRALHPHPARSARAGLVLGYRMGTRCVADRGARARIFTASSRRSGRPPRTRY